MRLLSQTTAFYVWGSFVVLQLTWNFIVAYKNETRAHGNKPVYVR